MDWFRSHHGAPTDPKWTVIAKRSETQPVVSCALWWALMDYASQHEDRGSVAGFDTETIAVFFGVDEAAIGRILDAMREKGLITDDRLTNWAKRQPAREDNSTERVRAFRQRKGTAGNARKRTVTRRNARVEEIDKREKIEQKQQKPARAKPPRASPDEPDGDRDTWLTPARDGWERIFGPGSFDFGKASKPLARLRHAGIEPDEIGARLRRYCEARREKYCTYADFAEHHAEWAEDDGPLVDADGVLTEAGERATRPAGVMSNPFGPLAKGAA